jgi:hypothetical protein
MSKIGFVFSSGPKKTDIIGAYLSITLMNTLLHSPVENWLCFFRLTADKRGLFGFFLGVVLHKL